MKDSRQLEFRAARSVYVLWLSIWLGLAALGAAADLRASSICVVLALVVAGWLRGFRITIAGDRLVYRDGFWRTVCIPLSDVKSIRINSKVFGPEMPRLLLALDLDLNK